MSIRLLAEDQQRKEWFKSELQERSEHTAEMARQRENWHVNHSQAEVQPREWSKHSYVTEQLQLSSSIPITHACQTQLQVYHSRNFSSSKSYFKSHWWLSAKALPAIVKVIQNYFRGRHLVTHSTLKPTVTLNIFSLKRNLREIIQQQTLIESVKTMMRNSRILCMRG